MIELWILRAIWVSLPLTAGGVVSDALEQWARGPRFTAAVLLWLAWAVVLVGLLSPRPVALTALRIVAPAAVIVAIAAAPGRSAAGAALALAATGTSLVLAALPAIGERLVDAISYGDEHRYLLRVPPALLLLPVPLAGLFVVAGVAIGPLLIADRRWIIGGLVTAVGLVLAAQSARALHRLARRWIVVVPAGIVLHDHLTLVDPVLFTRDRIAAVTPLSDRSSGTSATANVDPDVLDHRGGDFADSIELRTTEPAEMARTDLRRRAMVIERGSRIWFAPTRPATLLSALHERRYGRTR